MSRIVTTHYRYKRPPRKRKAVALDAPAVVTTKNSRRPVWGETAAEVQRAPVQEGTAQSSTPREAARVISPSHHSASPANDDRKSAIVTARRQGKRFPDVPDLTAGGAPARGDAADAMWSSLVGRATAKDWPRSTACRRQHQAHADLQKLIDEGRGDVPLTKLRFRCSNCGSDRTDFVVTSRDNPQPW